MPGNDEDLLRRSFRIAGHQTSLSMERAFWDEFRRMAQADRRSMTDLIAEIDNWRTAGLSRAVRIYILRRLQTAAHSKGDTS
ncbi:MAG: ribbon-helix-helix domain-containing protein [Alphaproteobacteria bacterium]|nr:ribbon-helix-helix domain-containing protein [Alphaproteobacteria bacterium]